LLVAQQRRGRSPRAQRAALPVIGILSPGSPKSDTSRMSAVRQGLKETGYVEDQNYAIEYRGAQDNLDLLPVLAADLVSRGVALIVTVGSAPRWRAGAPAYLRRFGRACSGRRGKDFICLFGAGCSK
jgi:ABC-type uncharacterized transport system substrate-binding protein